MIPPGRWLTALIVGFGWLIGAMFALDTYPRNHSLAFSGVLTIGSASIVTSLVGYFHPKGDVATGCLGVSVAPFVAWFVMELVLRIL